MYTQALFAFDRVKELAPQHPEWKTQQPFKGVLEDDMKAVGASGMKGLMEIVMATHSGMTAAEFEQEVSNWLATTKQPKFKRLYTELIYQPQLELLAYLRANGFKTFIVSGGGMAFMRPFSEEAYGIPPEQVVGSSVVAEFQVKDGKPALVRMPKIDFINDKAGKPVGIYEHIGRRPILAFGNSDSDMQMIEYTMAGEGRRLGLFVHHTDADREYAYDRKSHVGTLDKALDQADASGWIIVDMKNDWKQVFPDGGARKPMKIVGEEFVWNGFVAAVREPLVHFLLAGCSDLPGLRAGRTARHRDEESAAEPDHGLGRRDRLAGVRAGRSAGTASDGGGARRPDPGVRPGDRLLSRGARHGPGPRRHDHPPPARAEAGVPHRGPGGVADAYDERSCEAYFAAQSDRYQSPALTTFTHVFVDPDRAGTALARRCRGDRGQAPGARQPPTQGAERASEIPSCSSATTRSDPSWRWRKLFGIRVRIANASRASSRGGGTGP